MVLHAAAAAAIKAPATLAALKEAESDGLTPGTALSETQGGRGERSGEIERESGGGVLRGRGSMAGAQPSS